MIIETVNSTLSVCSFVHVSLNMYYKIWFYYVLHIEIFFEKIVLILNFFQAKKNEKQKT